MADKTDKQDALRRMREQGPARMGPFRIEAVVPKLRDKIKTIDPKKKRRPVDAKRKGKAT